MEHNVIVPVEVRVRVAYGDGAPDMHDVLCAYLRADSERENRAHEMADACLDAVRRLWPGRWLRQPSVRGVDLQVPRVERGLDPAWLRVSYTLDGWACSARYDDRDFWHLIVNHESLDKAMSSLLASMALADSEDARKALAGGVP